MKFKAQRSLLAQFADRLDGVLQNSNSPNDKGHLLALKTSGTTLSGTVVRDDLLANVSVDAASLNDKDLLNVLRDGSYAISGDQFIQAIKKTSVDGPVTVEFEDSQEGFVNDEDQEDEDQEDEEDELKAVGALRVEMPGLNKSREEFWFQCVELSVPSKVDADEDSYMTLPAKDYTKYVKQVGVAAGKNNQNIDRSHMLNRTDEKDSDVLELVTYDGHRLAWAKIAGAKGTKVTGITPYELTASVTKLLNPEADVALYRTKGPEGLVVAQEVEYGDTVIGRAVYRMYSMSTSFISFEQVIRSTDFRFSCKTKAQYLKHVVKRLSVIDLARTEAVFSPEDEKIIFSKASAKTRTKGVELPIFDAKGEMLELAVSSRFLEKIVDLCESEDVLFEFSGRKSLIRVVVSPSVNLFIQPFGRED